MNIDTMALRPVFDAYTQTTREDVKHTWLRRFVTAYHDRMDRINLTALSVDDLKTVLTPFLQSDSAYGGPVARQLSGLSITGWRTFCEATYEAPERGAAVLSTLFDESRELDQRLKHFDTHYEDRLKRVGTRLTNGRITLSPAIRLGFPTGLLMIQYPEEYIIYKFSEFRSFFEEYTDCTVSTAGSVNVIDQYVTLVSGCRGLRDALQEHDRGTDTNMLDVRNIIWTHETLSTGERVPDYDEESERWETEKTSQDGTEKPLRATELAEQLEQTGQIVLYGPPGTGKTWTAMRFSEWWTEQSEQYRSGQVETITFHPSFTYEDFVEGLTATVGEDGTVRYEYRAGVFRDFVETAREEYESTPKNEIAPRYVLVIDEINRGNVESVFGELITCLEREHRTDCNDVSVRLAHSKTPFSIPPNVYLIGTMNTADRSIALIDAAFRRRFRFLAFPPDYDLVCERAGFSNRKQLRVAARATSEPCLYARSILALESINEKLRADVDRGKQIGHTYLLTASDTNEVVNVWRYELLPLLEEYYYANLDRLRNVVFGGGGDRLFDWQSGQIRPFDAEDLRAALDDIIESSSTDNTANPTNTANTATDALQ
jgi:MoxR-like ATPase